MTETAPRSGRRSDVVALAQEQRSGPPRILLVATLRWPLTARLAMAFASLGCPVEAWCPPGHPLEKTRAARRIHHAGALAPLRSLRAAIGDAAPDFIVPCDDDAALHLQRLHADAPSSALGRLVERSLGTPASCTLATVRGELMRMARAEGVRVPATERVATPDDLDAWAAQHRFPAVLKVDRSWGGFGVTIVQDLAQAHAALGQATRRSPWRALVQLLLRRDPSQLLRLGGTHPGVTIQAFIAGVPANRAVACWQGEVLAGTSVVALQTRSPTGPATVVRAVANAEMAETAARLVRALGLSGLCGLDFVIEAATGAAWLIEVNPRATPICHLPLGAGRDLPAALHARLTGRAVRLDAPSISADVIAMFPGEWCRDPRSPYLGSAFHDVPWSETELVRDCVDLPWEERGLAARIRARLQPRRAAAVVSLRQRPVGPVRVR